MKRENKIVIVVIAIFVLIIGAAFFNAMFTKKRLEIYNIDQVESGLSSQRISELEGFVWEGLKNAKLYDSSTVGVTALIRPASFVKTEKKDMKSYSFLIDIDEYKATYLVSFSLMDGRGFYESPNINCPAQNLMKYPETNCSSEKTSSTLMTIGRYLPYRFNLSDGRLVTVSSGVSSDGNEYLNVRVSTCGDEAISAVARANVEEWIHSLGFDADNYIINVPEYCDGEF